MFDAMLIANNEIVKENNPMKKILAMVLAALLILSCAALAEEKITLKIYAQYSDDDTKVPYDYAVEKLAEAYPNVELELIVQAQDDGATLLGMASANNLPDIFQTSSGVLPTLRQSKQLMILNDVAEKTGFAGKVYDTCKEFLYSDDGNVYAFPYAGHEYVLLYVNTALFEQYNLELPTTFDEMIECAKVFNENGIVPMALFAQEPWNAAAVYDMVATRYNAGGIKALDEGTAAITDEAYVTAAEKVAEMAAAGMFQADVTSTNYDQAAQMFQAGQAAMFVNGQWYIEDATKYLGENVTWIPYPSYDEEAYEASKNAFAGGGSVAGYAVNPDGEHAELAAEVAAFMSEKYCEAKITLRNNPLVALDVGMTNDQLPVMMQELVDTIPSMTSTTLFTWGLGNATFTEAIGTWSQALVSGEYTAEEVIEEIAAAME